MSNELPETAPDNEGLTGLIFELASQLHAERARRIALECTLEEAGVLHGQWDAGLSLSDRYSARCQEALDDAMQGLMRVMLEDTDPRIPLRGEASGFGSDASHHKEKEA